jgi:uncharacterized protein (UPF0332 family)
MQGDHARAAASHWRIALVHPREALTINTRTAPGAAIHTASYAMFHAALAVLIQHDGPDTTKTHRGVMARYGLLLNPSEAGGSQASALKSVSRERMMSDYGGDPRPTADDARIVVERAIEFLKFNALKFGFPFD